MKYLLALTIVLTLLGAGLLLSPIVRDGLPEKRPAASAERPTKYISPYASSDDGRPSEKRSSRPEPPPVEPPRAQTDPPSEQPPRPAESNRRQPPSLPERRIDPEPNYDRKILEKMIHKEVNRRRRLAGLDKLKYDKKIASVARKYSRELAADAQKILDRGEQLTMVKLRHEGKTFGKTHVDRLYSKKIYDFNRAGENIFSSPLLKELVVNKNDPRDVWRKIWYTPEEVVYDSVTRWMLSPGHKKNILTPQYTHTGIGLVRVGDFVIATQLFVERVSCGYRKGDCCRREKATGEEELYCLGGNVCALQSDGEMKCQEKKSD